MEETLPERRFEVELWDGTRVEPTEGGGPTFRLRSPAALGHLLWKRGELGKARAYVSGEVAVDDLDAALPLLLWQRPQLGRAARARLWLAALRAHGLRLPPPPPEAELRLHGRRHTRSRDERAVGHHYDLPNEFFELVLDASMTYSCAIFSRGAKTLEEAQETKLDLVCRKLELQEGQRVLDIGCGWGSFALHAASRYGVHVVGVTLSPAQVELARRRVAEAGLDGRVEIRRMDYRELVSAGQTFDAIGSIGCVEHVGEVNVDMYAAAVARLLEPGGRVLNHGAALVRHGPDRESVLWQRYVHPDSKALHLSRVVLALERAGLTVEHAEAFPADYPPTFRYWAERLDARLEEAERLIGPERLRVWRLYLRMAPLFFSSGNVSIYQVRARGG